MAIQTASTVPTPTAASRPPVSGRAEGVAEPPKAEGIRDTIESIVIAFILAFVFRAFLVEAFVIPTGSMAPGLYGKHAQHRCALCGYSFAYGIREPARTPAGTMPGTLEMQGGFSVRCPNCGWADGGNAHLNASEDRRVIGNNGDRILVLKWPYDIGGDLLGPRRWDVVVFKDPEDGETNFIKRLIGLPGEVLEIINGDIYAAPLASVPEDIREALSRPPDPSIRERRRLTPDQEARLAKHLKIQRKTRIAQQSLWMNHYDHDFIPRLDRADTYSDFNPPRWLPDRESASGWDATTPVVTFTPKDDKDDWLRLVGKPIQDSYGYNDVSHHASVTGPVDVGDVRLRFVLIPRGDDGHVVLELRKGDDNFRTTIDMHGRVTLDRAGEGGVRLELGRAGIPPLRRGKPISVEFENLDYRVALRINDKEVLATDDSQLAPEVARLLRRPLIDGRNNKAGVAIAAAGLPLDIRHLAVDRDVYYRSDARFEQGNALGKRNPFADWPGWGTAANPILLRDDPPDYFCCGDNSPQSKDSRLWWEAAPFLEARGTYRLGTVPGDQMIGRAFFVYWPSGHRFSKQTPPIIPNVGRMRIIR